MNQNVQVGHKTGQDCAKESPDRQRERDRKRETGLFKKRVTTHFSLRFTKLLRVHTR